jgi:type I restriction enzyme R subunit
LWANPDTRQELLENLAKLGIEKDQLNDLKTMFHAENSDIFDILAHLSFDCDIKYRQERSEYAK